MIVLTQVPLNLSHPARHQLFCQESVVTPCQMKDHLLTISVFSQLGTS